MNVLYMHLFIQSIAYCHISFFYVMYSLTLLGNIMIYQSQSYQKFNRKGIYAVGVYVTYLLIQNRSSSQSSLNEPYGNSQNPY